MFVVRIFIVYFLIFHTGTRTDNAYGRNNLSDPCDDKRIILKTILVNGTIENRFRLGCTSTLFTMSGGSSSATWYARRSLVDNVWPEFFFFYEQAIVLRFIKILLGFEPVLMSLTCTFDLVAKNYSFSLHVDGIFFGFCTSNKKSYKCSAGRMTDFFRNLERYKGGKSIVNELKDHVRDLQHKWLGVCRRFTALEKNATHVYSLHYDNATDNISCSVSSSVPWRYVISINGSVINDTRTRYNRSNDLHTTVGDIPRRGGVHFVCIIASPNGTDVSRYLDIPSSTTLIPVHTSTTETHYDISSTVHVSATIEIKNKFVKKIMTTKEAPTFGTGPVASVVIMVSVAIVLMGSFIFREELISYIHKLQEVPTESPYKDILVSIEE